MGTNSILLLGDPLCPQYWNKKSKVFLLKNIIDIEKRQENRPTWHFVIVLVLIFIFFCLCENNHFSSQNPEMTAQDLEVWEKTSFGKEYTENIFTKSEERIFLDVTKAGVLTPALSLAFSFVSPCPATQQPHHQGHLTQGNTSCVCNFQFGDYGVSLCDTKERKSSELFATGNLPAQPTKMIELDPKPPLMMGRSREN